MRFRPIILAWLLLLCATLAIGGVAWWLLGREADRIDSLTAGTIANRTATVAENIDLLMDEIREGVNQSLVDVAQSTDSRRALSGLVESNPYIETGYYFRSADGVTLWYGDRGEFPLPSDLIAEEDGVQTVYPWSMPVLNDAPLVEEKAPEPMRQRLNEVAAPSDLYVQNEVANAAPQQQLYQSYANVEQEEAINRNIAIKEQREAVRKVGKSKSKSSFSSFFSDSLSLGAGAEVDAPVAATDIEAAINGAAEQMLEAELDDAFADLGPVESLGLRADEAELLSPFVAVSLRHGWFSTELKEQESWMAWAELPDADNYLGAWLNRTALSAEFEKVISLSQQGDVSFRLVDASGKLMNANLYSKSSYRQSPSVMLTLAVGSSLPGWSIQAYSMNASPVFGGGFRLIGGLFIFGLCAAILIGGALLLWQAQRDARDAQRKTSFVANVSHELKTPLTSIRLFAEMLTDGRVKEEPKKQVYLHTILNETQRLARLVNNVLDFSRLERGRRDANLQAVDLAKHVDSILESQKDRLEGEGLKLIYQIPDSSIETEVDCDALEQILINLLDNAAKYASEGLTAEVALTADAKKWSLSIRDFGPGIPPAERKQVFAAFHRVDDRLTAERPGCGLGLSISSRLAEEMGGQLSLQSNQPTGCCFTLAVPFRKESAHA